MLENQSFDRLLGFVRLDDPSQRIDGLTGDESQPVAVGDPTRVRLPRGISRTLHVTDPNPGHQFEDIAMQVFGREHVADPPTSTMDGFLANYARQTDSDDKPIGTERAAAALAGLDPSLVPVISTLARSFVVCDRWFSSVPGPTWPNRFFVHAATSSGYVDSPTDFQQLAGFLGKRFRLRTIFENLMAAGRTWAVYFGDHAQAFGISSLHRYADANFRRRTQFLPLTFEQIGADHRDLPISLAMVSSASFPPAVGPVTYAVGGRPPYEHVGDGGLFDNLGTESLATFFLKKIPRESPKRGLIIVIDAAFPFDANQAFLESTARGFQVFKNEPSRIVGIMEARANAYQLMLWDALRTEGLVLPDFPNLRVEVLRHTEPDWGVFKDLPEECRSVFSADVTAKAIKEAVSQIPTRFQVSPR